MEGLLKMMKPTVETILMVFNKVSRKRQIKHYGEWFAGGDLDYFGQSSYPIACNIIPPDLSAWEFIMPSIHWAIAVHLGPQVYFALGIYELQGRRVQNRPCSGPLVDLWIENAVVDLLGLIGLFSIGSMPPHYLKKKNWLS